MHSNTILLGKLNTMVITKLVLSLTLLYALRIKYSIYIYIYIYIKSSFASVDSSTIRSLLLISVA